MVATIETKRYNFMLIEYLHKYIFVFYHVGKFYLPPPKKKIGVEMVKFSEKNFLNFETAFFLSYYKKCVSIIMFLHCFIK